MGKLRGGTTIGGSLATHFGNFTDQLSSLTTVTLTGDATSTGTFDASGVLNLTTVVVNDSHTHSDSTIDNLDASAITTGTLTRPTSSSSASCTGNAATVTNGVYTSRTISTTSPITGGGDLSANRTISIPAATASVNGYMTSTYASKLDGIAASANNYSHPTHPGDDFSVDTGALTGAVVVSDIDINVTTDTLGHVTDANGTVSTRTLTLADLGYTGATNANYYTHPTYTARTETGDTGTLTGATVISDLDFNITTDTSGHVTACDITTLSTRNLTLADLGYTGATNANYYSLPVASATLGGVKSGTDITVDGSGNVSVNDDSHAHIIANVDGLQAALDAKATPANISTAISNLVDSSPTTLDTLNELAAALGDDPNFATTVSTTIGTKLAKASNLSDLTNVATARTNLGVDAAGTINYTHPTYTARTESGDTGPLTGATVISDLDFNITTDTSGHVTACDITTLATRNLTLADLGYTGATNANYYTHPSYDGDDFSVDTTALTGATVVSDIDINVTTDASGHVTDANGTVATRNLTLADLGYTGTTDANTYVHPTHPGDDASVDTGALTGATVISDLDFNITTDTLGHVTDANATVATRNLTLADFGYTGATNANYYTHPTYTARTETGDTGTLTGATVISDLDFNITTDTSGHVTACDITTLATRNLTLADLGYTGATNANYYSLPVASTTIGGVKSGTDITVDGSGNVSVNDDSHAHTIANVDGLQAALDNIGSGLPLLMSKLMELDDTDIESEYGNCFSMIPTIDFPSTTADGSCWVSFHFLDTLDASKNINLDLVYSLNGADDSATVRFLTKYWCKGVNETPSISIPTGTNTNAISTGTSQSGKILTTTLTAIPNASVSSGDTITLKFTREGSNVADTYAGTFQLLYVIPYQT